MGRHPAQSDLSNVIGGADVFVFAQGSGKDEIWDFQIGKGYGYANSAALSAHISDDGSGNAVIQLNGATDEVALTGVQTASLHAGDLIFG